MNIEEKKKYAEELWQHKTKAEKDAEAFNKRYNIIMKEIGQELLDDFKKRYVGKCMCFNGNIYMVVEYVNLTYMSSERDFMKYFSGLGFRSDRSDLPFIAPGKYQFHVTETEPPEISKEEFFRKFEEYAETNMKCAKERYKDHEYGESFVENFRETIDFARQRFEKAIMTKNGTEE